MLPLGPRYSLTRRYLTPETKQRELVMWEDRKAAFASGLWLGEPIPTHVPLGGLGYPDPLMYRWCDRLNKIPGVCTLQSCCGHEVDGTHYPGQLWLWLDKGMAQAVYPHIFTLLEHRCMEGVRTLYLRGGREVLDVTFHGEERGLLQPSMRHICGFFRKAACDGF